MTAEEIVKKIDLLFPDIRCDFCHATGMATQFTPCARCKGHGEFYGKKKINEIKKLLSKLKEKE